LTGPGAFYGILKPPGMTAHDVVAVARKKLGTKKIGHAGTLDPLAAGVLPIAAGNCTRLLQYVAGDKEYLAEIAFGRATTTADAAGEVTAEQPVEVGEPAVREALARFIGEIAQVPPAYSAVHVGGIRAYELARAGVSVEVPPRMVRIDALELLRWTPTSVLVRVSCSAGTYVRTLAVDLGKALGAPAHLAFLLRTRAGAVGIADANRLTDASWCAIMPGDFLRHLPALAIDEPEAAALRQGKPIREVAADRKPTRAMLEGDLVAIVRAENGAYWPKTVLAV
jgi:tRNA pseudouridine55 synthase